MSFNVKSDEILHQPDGQHAAEHDEQVEADDVAAYVFSGDGGSGDDLDVVSLALRLSIDHKSSIFAFFNCLCIFFCSFFGSDIKQIARLILAFLGQKTTINHKVTVLVSKASLFEHLL